MSISIFNIHFDINHATTPVFAPIFLNVAIAAAPAASAVPLTGASAIFTPIGHGPTNPNQLYIP